MSTRNTVVTAILTSLITSICTFFVLDYIKTRKKKKEVTVPKVVGLRPSVAMELLKSRNLRLQIIERRPDAKYPDGVICYQRPLPQSKMLQQEALSVVLSSGPPKVTIPNCAGALAQVKTRITQAQLKVGSITYKVVTDKKAGEVLSCKPPPGGTTSPGTLVNLVVAKVDAMVEMPKFKGKSCRKAKKEIAELGLVVGKIRWREYDAPPYLVMKQTPDPKTKVKKGTKVDLTCNLDD